MSINRLQHIIGGLLKFEKALSSTLKAAKTPNHKKLHRDPKIRVLTDLHYHLML